MQRRKPTPTLTPTTPTRQPACPQTLLQSTTHRPTQCCAMTWPRVPYWLAAWPLHRHSTHAASNQSVVVRQLNTGLWEEEQQHLFSSRLGVNNHLVKKAFHSCSTLLLPPVGGAGPKGLLPAAAGGPPALANGLVGLSTSGGADPP